MEEVNEEGDEVDKDNSIEEGLSGGTQTLLNSIENEDINKALEAEIDVFDDLGNLLEGDIHLVSLDPFSHWFLFQLPCFNIFLKAESFGYTLKFELAP